MFKEKFYVLTNDFEQFLVDSCGEGTFFSDIKEAIQFEDKDEVARFFMHNKKFEHLNVKEVNVTYEVK